MIIQNCWAHTKLLSKDRILGIPAAAVSASATAVAAHATGVPAPQHDGREKEEEIMEEIQRGIVRLVGADYFIIAFSYIDTLSCARSPYRPSGRPG